MLRIVRRSKIESLCNSSPEFRILRSLFDGPPALIEFCVKLTSIYLSGCTVLTRQSITFGGIVEQSSTALAIQWKLVVKLALRRQLTKKFDDFMAEDPRLFSSRGVL